MGARHPAEVERLQRRLDELESRVRSLRMSRRVLLDLLRRVHDHGRRRIQHLEAEVARLRARNRTYALRLWEQNRVLARLGAREAPVPGPGSSPEPAPGNGVPAGNGPYGSKEHP